MYVTIPALIVGLRARGVVFVTEGDHVRIRGKWRAITPDELDRLYRERDAAKAYLRGCCRGCGIGLYDAESIVAGVCCRCVEPATTEQVTGAVAAD